MSALYVKEQRENNSAPNDSLDNSHDYLYFAVSIFVGSLIDNMHVHYHNSNSNIL